MGLVCVIEQSKTVISKLPRPAQFQLKPAGIEVPEVQVFFLKRGRNGIVTSERGQTNRPRRLLPDSYA